MKKQKEKLESLSKKNKQREVVKEEDKNNSSNQDRKRLEKWKIGRRNFS